MNDDLTAQSRRDRLFRRIVLCAALLFTVPYALLDSFGVLPEAVSARHHINRRRNNNVSNTYRSYDPNLILGIAIGDTRYRFNYAEHFALVTRPLFGVEVWRIPETVEYEGETYTVTSLDTFALLHAITVRKVELPTTLRYFNGAPSIANETIEHISVGDRYHAAPKDFDIQQARIALGLDPNEEAPIIERIEGLDE